MQQYLQQSSEDRFLGAIGMAFTNYKEEKDHEIEYWKTMCEQKEKENEGLKAFIRSLGYEVPDTLTLFNSIVPPKESRKKAKKNVVFANLIQHPDKELVLKRLHDLIDGHGGIQVAVILRRALEDKLITKHPNEKEFFSEFKNVIGKWDSIKKYLSSTKTVDTTHIQILFPES